MKGLSLRDCTYARTIGLWTTIGRPTIVTTNCVEGASALLCRWLCRPIGHDGCLKVDSWPGIDLDWRNAFIHNGPTIIPSTESPFQELTHRTL